MSYLFLVCLFLAAYISLHLWLEICGDGKLEWLSTPKQRNMKYAHSVNYIGLHLTVKIKKKCQKNYIK